MDAIVGGLRNNRRFSEGDTSRRKNIETYLLLSMTTDQERGHGNVEK